MLGAPQRWRRANRSLATLGAMPSLRHLVIFVLVLILLRRFLAVPVSIAGSLILTVVVSIVVSALARDRS